MKPRGVLFARFFSVVIITILMTALFTTLVYTYISREVFTQIKEGEMLQKARALGRILHNHDLGVLEQKTVLQIIEAKNLSESMLGAYVVVADADGSIQYASESLNLIGLSALEEPIAYILRGEKGNIVRTDQIQGLKGSNFVIIGTPIYNETEDQMLGAVLMFTPLYEAIAAMSGLNGALLISLLISMPFVAVLVYYVIGLVVRPLRQMRDVAINMASGNFSARADDTQRGEIGQLGHSLNYLARALSRSISDLTLERNRLQQTIDGLSEGLVAVDQRCSITHSNPALRTLFPPTAESDSSDAKRALIPHDVVWDAFRQAVDKGEHIVLPLTLPNCIVQVSITPLFNTHNEAVGAVGLFRDITESERLERTRRDYVANVSHEMRTPLTAMRGLLEPLSDGMVTNEETRNRYYSILMREALRLSRLIDDLMELSRLQSGTLALETHRMRVQQVIDDIESKYASTAEENGLTFYVSSNAESCPPVVSNPDRVEQALVILLDNAMKYTPEEGTVSIDADWDEERVIISVRDTGIGIAPEDQAHVFERFYKVDKAHTGLGSGLGLSIASEMLRQMGEEIWLKSVEGEGTTFQFTLQRAME